MYIAATGPALRATRSSTTRPGESGTVIFSHYGKAVTLTIPPEPINLSYARLADHCRTDPRTPQQADYLNMSPRILAPPMPAAAPSTPWWSSRSGMYSPMTPARIGSGIDCSQMRPGPVSTAKWCPSAPM